VDAPERAGDCFGGGDDDRMARGLRLELREGLLEAGQRGLRVRDAWRPPCALDLMERAHGLREGRGELDQMGGDVGVALQRIEAARERLARGTSQHDDVGHVCLSLSGFGFIEP
jgi:hypothetical protein